MKCQLDRRLSAAAASEAAFETRDFYLACFLRCTGYDLLDLRAEGRRKVFVFRDRPTRRDDVLAFYGDGASGSAARVLRHHQGHEGTAAQCVNASDPRRRQRARRPQVREALDRLEELVVDGLRHGFFDCSIACEIGNGGKRQLVIRGRQVPQVHDPRGRTAALTRRR